MTWAFLIDSVPFTAAVVAGETSLGGSESACLGLARALVRRGHTVHVYATKLDPAAAGADGSGLLWDHAEHFPTVNQWIEYDVVVALRQSQWFAHTVRARLRLLWNQDLLTPGRGHGAMIMAVAWALDHLVYVSDYHRRQWEDQESALASIGWVTKNGFDPTHVPSGATKDPNRILHISRPERGLRPLLEMWPALKRQHPAAELRICRYASMYDGEGSTIAQMCAQFDELTAAVNREVGGITVLGALNKTQLYQEIATAAVMWYPGIAEFAETSCIAAIESQACGTPFVGSWRGALPETVPSGVLVKGDPGSPEYRRESIAAVLDLMDGCASHSFAYRQRQTQGRHHVKAYTYDALAAEWDAQIEAWFSERYETHKVGVLRQLLHEDDHVVAQIVARDLLDDEFANAAAKEADEARAFCDRVIAGREQSADQYAAHSIQDPLEEVKFAGRFAAVAPQFAACAHVLDVACGNGAGAIAFALTHPSLKVTGLDYAPDNIRRARDAAERAGVGDRCTFETCTVYDFDAQRMHADWQAFIARTETTFDGLFVGEFLEHVADATGLVEALEAVVSPGAAVVYTCPLGPIGKELRPRGQVEHCGHVHCFKYDDLTAVFGRKREFGADCFYLGLSTRGTPIGHWIIRYRVAAHCPAGTRDLQTRARRTRPLQKLTVGIIAADAELDVGRCLDSVWPIADEILVGDTGSIDATADIARRYGARVLPLASIQQQPEGFAGARNAVLDAATGDWFLWIDADERLMEAQVLRRYLDGAVFHGFVLHQTHLYLDGAPTYDIPVRLFRLHQGIRFYGCVHEQPQMGDANTDIHPTLEPFDVRLAHTGYLTERIRESKRTERNLPLMVRDQAVFPTRLLGKLILLRETALQADTERAAHRGELTDRAEAGFRHALTLYDTYFADPTHKLHKLARPWYEAALQGLGLGYEMEIAVAGKEGGLGPSHAAPERIWVRDAAEFQRLMTFKARGIADKMTPPAMKTAPDLGVAVDVPDVEAVPV